MSISFVTGANSFLGATLIRHLLASGRQVRGLLRSESNDILLRDFPIERVTGDLLQPATYRHALSGCDELYHVAASYTQVPEQLAQMEETNAAGTRLVLEAALDAGAARLLHTSTIGVIGQPQDGSLATERDAFNLLDPTPYVRSKLTGEQIAFELARQGEHIVIVNPTAMLGPGDWRPTASGRRVLDFLHRRIPRYPAGGINWCPVDDVARGMIQALERGQPGRRYILGHQDGNLDLDGFLALLSRASGLPIPQPPRLGWRTRAKALIRRSQPRPTIPETATTGAAPERLTCDPTRTITELNMPQSELLAAAQQQVAWYRENNFI
jgi:dihydroflavonol-4-reductase